MIQLWENWLLVAWKVGEGISDDLRHILVVFCLKGAPNNTPGSPMVPNGQPSVPWEVEIRNYTVGWFNYGKLGVSPMEAGQGNIWWFKACFVHFLSHRSPPRPHQSPQKSQMDDLVFHEKSRKKIALWDYSTMGQWVLVLWKADNGISDYLRHGLVISGSKGPPRGSLGSPTVPNGRPSVPWEVKIHFTLGLSNCGKTGC